LWLIRIANDESSHNFEVNPWNILHESNLSAKYCILMFQSLFIVMTQHKFTHFKTSKNILCNDDVENRGANKSYTHQKGVIFWQFCWIFGVKLSIFKEKYVYEEILKEKEKIGSSQPSIVIVETKLVCGYHCKNEAVNVFSYISSWLFETFFVYFISLFSLAV
jgi:hypothetical protein